MATQAELQLSAIFINYRVADFAFAMLGTIRLTDLIIIAEGKNKQLAFRAAWLLETIVLKETKHITNVYQSIIKQLPIQKNWSCLRSYSKICMWITDKKQNLIVLEIAEEETLINCFFTCLTDPKCPVAVTVNALDVLYNLSDRHHWIQGELVAQIEFLLKKPSPALLSRAKRVKLKLQKNNR